MCEFHIIFTTQDIRRPFVYILSTHKGAQLSVTINPSFNFCIKLAYHIIFQTKIILLKYWWIYFNFHEFFIYTLYFLSLQPKQVHNDFLKMKTRHVLLLLELLTSFCFTSTVLHYSKFFACFYSENVLSRKSKEVWISQSNVSLEEGNI